MKKYTYCITCDLFFEEDFKCNKNGDVIRDFRIGFYSDLPFVLALDSCIDYVNSLFCNSASLTVTRFVRLECHE